MGTFGQGIVITFDIRTRSTQTEEEKQREIRLAQKRRLAISRELKDNFSAEKWATTTYFIPDLDFPDLRELLKNLRSLTRQGDILIYAFATEGQSITC